MQFLLKLFTLLGVLIFYAQCDNTLDDTTVSVVTLLAAPYTMLRDGHTNLTGNERYEGYMVDLMDLIAQRLGFKYELYIEPNGQYGSFHNGKWDGVVGEVHSGRATIGAAPLTITSARHTAVDFTHPFMYFGIGILYKRASAGKTIPFRNVEELAALKTTNFGCILHGSTCQFFTVARNGTYKRMYERMVSAEPSAFVHSVSEGMERVKNEDYAFFIESTAAEYAVERDCHLQQVGGLLSQKSFGLAVQIGSPIRVQLSKAILMLEESGDLQALKEKWWKASNGEECVH